MHYTIKGRLDGLNEYIAAMNINRHVGNKLKQKNQDYISLFLRPVKQFSKQVKVHFFWIEPNTMRDVDNIAFAKKFILDALVKKGILPNDTQRWVKGFSDQFEVDKDNPRIEITIEEVT